jgi:PhnO protein
MRKIISLLFVVISFQIFGATSGTENKEFDYQKNFSQQNFCNSNFYKINNNGLIQKTFEIIESILEENTRNPNYHYLIAENEQNKFGFISFHIQNLLHHSGLVGEIQEFFIVEQFRGKGIGKQLVDEIFKISEQLNLKSIEVTTNKKKTDNILVYQSLGFNLSHNKFTIYR